MLVGAETPNSYSHENPLLRSLRIRKAVSDTEVIDAAENTKEVNRGG